MQQSIGACGGSGWLALQMGLGKTAVAIATILLNPPPAGWSTKRPWKDPVARDCLGERIVNRVQPSHHEVAGQPLSVPGCP